MPLRGLHFRDSCPTYITQCRTVYHVVQSKWTKPSNDAVSHSSALDDAGPRAGGPETLCELPRDAELLLLLDELLAHGSLFAKTLIAPVPLGSLSRHHLAVVARVTAPAASLIALCHDIHSVLLNRSKPSGGKLSSHFSHSWGYCSTCGTTTWYTTVCSKSTSAKCLHVLYEKNHGGRSGNSREGERKFRQHQHRASVVYMYITVALPTP